MGGGLLQLVAYGAQDVYLTGKPQMTFFKAAYKRHTNFAMETIEQVINGTPAVNGRSSVTISRNGDLVQEMFLSATSEIATIPSTEDNIYVAERMVADCELTIGGQRIDKLYQRWWRLFSELYNSAAKKDQYSKMVNATNALETVYLPLIFFFNRNPGLALPLIALQYHECRLDFTWTSEFSFVSNVKCWANYIYLDTREREIFAQKSHEYLIEQVQFTGSEAAVLGSTKNIRLNYNHPVKELVWCFDDPAQGSTNRGLWNMTATSGTVATTFYSPGAGSSKPHEADGVIRLDTGYGFSEGGPGPLEKFKLQLNGQDRFAEQEGKYFNQVQPYYHHTGNPVPGIYSYSFALKPERHQPSGTCNFSRIDNATAVVTIKAGASNNTNFTMFATNYNVLRVMDGMGGLAYSN